jgi:hypothetical protein
MFRPFPMRPLLCLLLLFLSPIPVRAVERSFWVVDRTTPLDDSELEQLTRMGVKKLYWAAATAKGGRGTWVWSKWPGKISVPEGIRIVPVVRLEFNTPEPFSEEMLPSLERRMEEIVKRHGRAEVQIDCMVPDRLLASYAKCLARLRRQVDFLGITAHIRWCSHPAFDDLTASVDEIVPLFYDYDKDNARDLKPLVDPEVLHDHIAGWKKCRIPWRVGLPWFARASVYGADGEERGRVLEWTWDDIAYNSQLALAQPTRLGLTVFTALRTTYVGRTALRTDDMLVVRRPDLAALVGVENEAGRDVIYHSLPSIKDANSWSLQQAANIGSGEKPRLVLQPGSGITLINESGVDLPPMIDGPAPVNRGYSIELDAGEAIFRDVRPGDFHHVEGRGDPETRGLLSRSKQKEDLQVTVIKATRVLLYFSHMPAGRVLKTRLFQLTPGTPATQLRYRINGVPGGGEWHGVPLQ